jgi:arylsulfatase A-like enzyme
MLDRTRLRFALTTLGAFAAASGPPAADAAQCASPNDLWALKTSVSAALSCNQLVLTSTPPPSCNVPSPPPCADSLVVDASALVYGPNNPASSAVSTSATGLKKQLDCQNEIARSTLRFVSTKLGAMIQGSTSSQANALAAPTLDGIAAKCAGVPVKRDASGVVLPAVGPQCAAAIGAVGVPVDTTALTGCVRTLLSLWVDRIGPSPAPLRPNVVLIVSDDQRWDTTRGQHSLSGAPVMPGVVGELAASGVELTNAFVTTPLCAPSRAAILTGRYSHHTGVQQNGAPTNALAFDDSATIATAMQAAGYRTGFVGKYVNGYDQLWVNGSTPYMPPGWDDWRVFRVPRHFDYKLVENGVVVAYTTQPSDYATDVLRAKASSFIDDSVAAGAPFFLVLAMYAPNSPAAIAAQSPAPRHIGAFAGLAPFRPTSYNEPDLSDKPAWLQSFPSLTQAQQDAQDTYRRAQLEMLLAVDEAVGGSATYGIEGVMDTLRVHGVEDDTFVAFVSDNGVFWGEHRFLEKYRTYDENLRVPLFVRYPRLAPLPRTEDDIVLNIDLAPTIAELAGATLSGPADGRSFVRVLDGTEHAWRTDFLTEGWSKPLGSEWAGVRDQRWKYNEYKSGDVELYDLQADPLELDNRAADPANASRVAAMAARLRAIRPTWPADVP